MADGNFAYIIFLVAGGFVLARAKSRQASTTHVLIQLALAFYVSRLVAYTFFPFPFEQAWLDAQRQITADGLGATNNFELFETVRRTWGRTFLRQILGNLVLLFPLGVLAPLVFPRLRGMKRGAALIVMTAISIESLQLLGSLLLGYVYKSFDVDDLWLNSLGGTAGVAASHALLRGRLSERVRTVETASALPN